MKAIISAVLAAVLAGALGFYGGVTYQKSQTQSAVAGRASGQGGGFAGGQGQNGGAGAGGQGQNGGAGAGGQRGFNRGNVTTGTILAVDATSITVKTADGGSKKVFLSANTRYTQQQQLTCWGDNVQSLAVRGSFDDCQRLVKQAFMEPEFAALWDLSSANSINLGRLLPPAVYYAATSVQLHARTGAPASFIIPSGNLGNATACVWARRLGAPIADIILAHNANRTVPDFLGSGALHVRPSVATLASAMDVGNPSNLERLTAMFPDIGSLRQAVSAVAIDDDAIRARIRTDHEHYGVIWCPHTATAAEAWARL
jgi:threonine synthase